MFVVSVHFPASTRGYGGVPGAGSLSPDPEGPGAESVSIDPQPPASGGPGEGVGGSRPEATPEAVSFFIH